MTTDKTALVLGATGVTGRRVCAHLAQRSAEGGIRWAAGVDRVKKPAARPLPRPEKAKATKPAG